MRSTLSLTLLAAAVAAVSCLFSVRASAQEPARQASPIVAAPDNLSGHLILAPRLGLLNPMGSFESGFKQSDFNTLGPAFGVDLSFGVSRYLAINGFFEMASLGAHGDECPSGGDCKAKSSSFGLGLEYHLINGASFDPWLRWGLGYRLTSLDYSWSGYSQKLDYKGMQWLHLAIGGDFFASRKLGFGPYLSFDFGSYSSRPSAPRPHAQFVEREFHSFLGFGVRGVFDLMR